VIVRFLEPAEVELRAAVAWYNEKRTNLGDDFADEVSRVLDLLSEHPRAGVRLSPLTRRMLLRRFPYGVVYQERSGEILVVAIFHCSREPDSWRGRVERE